MERSYHWLRTLFAIGALCAACADENTSDMGPSSCMPNVSVQCACAGGTVGIQTCAPDGLSFGACTCPGAAGQAGTLGTAGSNAGNAGVGLAGVGAGSGGLGSAGAGSAGSGTAGSSGAAGMGGSAGSGGLEDAGTDSGSTASAGETGRMVGITAAHNARRAQITMGGALPELTWSQDLADFAQGWADQLASSCQPSLSHRPNNSYGENIAAWFGSSPPNAAPEDIVEGWAAEEACWEYGTIRGTEVCDMTCTAALYSNGCGHYTQVVARRSTKVGCAVATCNASGTYREYWVCNYDPPGNIVGQTPF